MAILKFKTQEEAESAISKLEKAGEFILYEIEDNAEDIFLSYYRDIVPDQKNKRMRKAELGERMVNYKIKKSEFAEHLHNNENDLESLIYRCLKILLGWDFDLTQTKIHTWHHSEELDSGEIKPEEIRFLANEMDLILNALKKKANIFQFIATNNLEERVQKCLNAWEINELFAAIICRDIWHGLKPSSGKATCFWLAYQTLNIQQNNNGYLDIKKLLDGEIIDTPWGYLIDDDVKELRKAENYGLNTIYVSNTDNLEHTYKPSDEEKKHLFMINEKFNLNVNLDLKSQQDSNEENEEQHRNHNKRQKIEEARQYPSASQLYNSQQKLLNFTEEKLGNMETDKEYDASQSSQSSQIFSNNTI